MTNSKVPPTENEADEPLGGRDVSVTENEKPTGADHPFSDLDLLQELSSYSPLSMEILARQLENDDLRLTSMVFKNASQIASNNRSIAETTANIQSSHELIARFWEHFGESSDANTMSSSRERFIKEAAKALGAEKSKLKPKP